MNKDSLAAPAESAEADDSESSASARETKEQADPTTEVMMQVLLNVNGVPHEFEYGSLWEVKAVMANICRQVTLEKHMALFHPAGYVYLEPQKHISCYWDNPEGPLSLSLMSTVKVPTHKEIKVRFNGVKKSIVVFKSTTALGREDRF